MSQYPNLPYQKNSALPQQLETCEVRYRCLVEAIPQIVWRANAKGEITDFNQRWQAHTGLSVAASLGRNYLQAIHPQDRDRLQSQWQQTSPYEIEFRLRQADQTYHRFIARGQPVRLENGELVEWIGTYTHLDKLERTETALPAQQPFLQALLDNLSDGIVACNERGVLTLFNRASQNFHEKSAEAIAAEAWADRYDLYLPDGKTPMSKEQIPLFRALNGESVCNVEVKVVPPSGRERTLLASGDAIFAPNGEKLGAVVAMRDITQRKQAEAAMHDSERRFRAIFHQTFQLMALLQPDGILREANQTALDFGGLTAADVGRPFWEAGWWRRSPESRDRLQGAIASHQFVRYEAEISGAGNAAATIDFSLKPVKDETGKIIWLIAEGRDITERKQARAEVERLNRELERRVAQRTTQLEAANCFKDELLVRERTARRETEAAKAQIDLYKDIFENTQVGLCVWQLEDFDDLSSFRLIAVNPAATALSGVAFQDCIGRGLTECFPNVPENNQALLLVLAEVIQSGEARDLDKFYYDNAQMDASTFTAKIFPLPDNCAGVAFENISERQQIEKALVETTQRYRQVVNSVKEVIFQTDLAGRWTFLNPAWTEITGFTVLESLDSSFVDYIFAPEDREACAKLFQSLIMGDRQEFSCEFRSQTKDGNFCWLEMTAQVNRHAGGEVMGTSGTINDITERKQTEAVLQSRADELADINSVLLATTEQLQKRNRELDRFAYVTSHDLKAPLRAIANLSEWIEEDLENLLTEDTRHQMNLLRGRVHRMEALINGLLEYSRAGRVKSQPERVSVSKLLVEIIDSLPRPSEFMIELEGEMPILITEKLPLQQVFTNLISNGIKHHNRPDGNVKISVQDGGKFYEFAVTDDGAGIAPEYREKVFIIFQTLEARDKTENTGIGLAIVKKTVEERGGTIELESEVGGPTTFRFTWSKSVEEGD